MSICSFLLLEKKALLKGNDARWQLNFYSFHGSEDSEIVDKKNVKGKVGKCLL